MQKIALDNYNQMKGNNYDSLNDDTTQVAV